ncbi:MAG: AraC family transcriptional regulator [Planctomycetota bacterium]
MDQGLAFHPVAVDAWLLLRALPQRLGRIPVWRARDHPPAGSDLHQHACTTLVACLRGALRLTHPRGRCDLGPGDVLLLRPGAWHLHEALHGDALAFCQGFLGGRSDFFLDTRELHLLGSVPEQPSRGLMERAARSEQTAERRELVAQLIGNLTRECSAPLTTPHPALARMELALWQHLHRTDALQAIINASGLARAQAYRLFTAHWGTGMAAMVRRERIRLARELIADGIPVGEAAKRCGFASRRAFTRAYRQVTGRTPSAQERP